MLNNEFILQSLEILRSWAIKELPIILVLTIGLFILFRIVKASIKKLKIIMLKQAEKNPNIDTAEAEKRINTLVGIIWGIVKIILITVYIMFILQKMGLNIAPILASAGILGLAIGFGAQELVRDVISGFFILLENQIRVGDAAIINGTGGAVEDIKLRTITLRDFSGCVHIFQNGKISTLSNMTKEWSAAVLQIGVAYKEDVEVVMDLMKSVGDELQLDSKFKDSILEPIEIMGLDQFADSAVMIKARIKTKPSMQWMITREYNKRIKYVFDKNNIEIPFPHRTVYIADKNIPIKLDLNTNNLPKS